MGAALQVNTDDFERYARNAEVQRQHLGELRAFITARVGDTYLTPSDLSGSIQLANASAKTGEPLSRYVAGAEEGVHFIALFAQEVHRRFPEREHINAKMITDALAAVPRVTA